jgi:hypothetical protein
MCLHKSVTPGTCVMCRHTHILLQKLSFLYTQILLFLSLLSGCSPPTSMLGHFPICIQKACLCNSFCCLLLSHVTFLVQEESKCLSAAVLPCSSASSITFNLKPIVYNILVYLLHIPLRRQIYFQQTHNHCRLLTYANYWTPSVRYNETLFRSLWKWVMC